MRGKRLRVLLIYHGAALKPSQKIFHAIAAHKEIQLRVLGPRKGFNRMRHMVMEISHPYHGDYDLVTGRVYKAMEDFSGPYLTGLIREILFFRPHIIHVFHEAYSSLNLQTLIYRRISRPSARCFCLGVENIIKKRAKTRKGQFKRNFIHKHCDGVACWSESARNALMEAGFPAEKLTITYWGIPLDQFSPSRNEELRLQLGVAEKFVIGYVGRFEPEKGLLTLLNALKTLPEIVHCICVGDGSWRETFLSKVQEFGLSNRFYWIPRVTDKQVPNYINAMDVLVLPSETTPLWKEQFGRVLVEAMASGVPCIGSDSGAIPEILGASGIVFRERDHIGLGKAIDRLKSDSGLYRQLRRSGLDRSRTFFSCEVFARKLLNMYKLRVKVKNMVEINPKTSKVPENKANYFADEYLELL